MDLHLIDNVVGSLGRGREPDGLRVPDCVLAEHTVTPAARLIAHVPGALAARADAEPKTGHPFDAVAGTRLPPWGWAARIWL